MTKDRAFKEALSLAHEARREYPTGMYEKVIEKLEEVREELRHDRDSSPL